MFVQQVLCLEYVHFNLIYFILHYRKWEVKQYNHSPNNMMRSGEGNVLKKSMLTIM